MRAVAEFRRESAEDQAECARQIVAVLFDATGLSTIVRTAPRVVLGDGNWISFTAERPVSAEEVLGLAESGRGNGFVRNLFRRRSQARSRTGPSLHLTNLGSGEALRGTRGCVLLAAESAAARCGIFFKANVGAFRVAAAPATVSRCGLRRRARRPVIDEAVTRRKPGAEALQTPVALSAGLKSSSPLLKSRGSHLGSQGLHLGSSGSTSVVMAPPGKSTAANGLLAPGSAAAGSGSFLEADIGIFRAADAPATIAGLRRKAFDVFGKPKAIKTSTFGTGGHGLRRKAHGLARR
jgi:hypothetical protein